MEASKLCVLIPSLEPDERLPKYVDSLLAAGFGLVLIVNDGSGPHRVSRQMPTAFLVLPQDD